MYRLVLNSALLLMVACGQSVSRDAGTSYAPRSPDFSQWDSTGDGGARLLSELFRARRGEAADFDGDGVRELLVLKYPDGTVEWILENGGPVPSFQNIQKPDGTRVESYFYSNNGAPSLIIHTYPAEQRRTLTFDDDLNRKPERRLIERLVGGNEVEGIEEEDKRENGQWVESARWKRPLVLNQGKCVGTTNFPQKFDVDLNGSLSILSDGPVACNPEQSQKLRQAFRCAFDRLDCLRRSNQRLASRIAFELSVSDYYHGCNNLCAGGTIASTDHWFSFNAGRTNWSPAFLSSLSDAQLCTAMLHEMMHFADVEAGDKHDDGVDTIYSCARHCTYCAPFGPKNPPPTRREDCARCAGTEAERRKCGIKKTLGMMSCPALDLCHGTIGTNVNCSTCEGQTERDCADRQFSTPSTFSCCQTCPTNAPQNDKPCPGPLSASDDCLDERRVPECPP